MQGLDYGDYLCVGRNDIGASCSHIVLYETADCQTKECPDLSRQYAPVGGYGSAGTVKCNVISILSLLSLVLYGTSFY